MIWIAIIAVVVACMVSVCVRVVLRHPLLAVYYAVKDGINYFRFKKWRIPQTGRILAYLGMFRSGKTLSGTEYIESLYKQYDGLQVYDAFRKKWVTQKVHVVSNVEFKNIDFDYLVSLEQVVHISNTTRELDEQNDTLTIHVVFVDEASVQLNSRAFKTNIDPLFLSSLLTCGHVYMMFVYTAQEFCDVDALLRRVTSYCFNCQKVWRIMTQSRYSARELEYAANPMDVKPLNRFGWFIRDANFAAYDTHACVENLKKDFKDGNMMTEEEILALRCHNAPDMDAVQKPSKRFLKRIKKLKR